VEQIFRATVLMPMQVMKLLLRPLSLLHSRLDNRAALSLLAHVHTVSREARADQEVPELVNVAKEVKAVSTA